MTEKEAAPFGAAFSRLFPEREKPLAQPSVVLPVSRETTAQITPMKLSRETTSPRPVMMRMGLMLRLVIPLKARASILDRG